jgi:hypothetical protein
VRTKLFDPARHDPRDPNPWMAVYLDGSLPIADDVKRAWLTDCGSWSRQWLLPLVRPLAKLAVILVQLIKMVLPKRLTSSTALHWLIAKSLARFATPEANWLILRHFHVGAHNLAWLNANVAGGRLALDSIRPSNLEDLRDHLFVRHDINLYNFVIELNLHLRGQPIGRRDLGDLDFTTLPDDGSVPVRYEEMPRGALNFIDLQTAIEIFTPIYALFLSDADFWRATHSLQLDETIASYGAALTGRTDALMYVNNRHPMIPDITMNGAFRLILHGLATEVMFALVLQLKRAQQEGSTFRNSPVRRGPSASPA